MEERVSGISNFFSDVLGENLIKLDECEVFLTSRVKNFSFQFFQIDITSFNYFHNLLEILSHNVLIKPCFSRIQFNKYSIKTLPSFSHPRTPYKNACVLQIRIRMNDRPRRIAGDLRIGGAG